ncbi:NAD-dependent epimerase/dehydratase family protein [Vibrio coralliilyticus]|uniref:NAD-dependent epimerase/dehydratase family protein n=1 Tax=Vibrio coralliilyticus TaxID=190893 RepID=UPI001805BF9F|nr:NAD(P)-dependent oxidoreductase [Vibrio coralliilyticus]NUW66077.1 NAD(P)-dependent oxidoreductase [Vibrio coralliilyticus]
MIDKKIVVTGISGTIGKYIIKTLVSQGFNVTAISRRPIGDDLGADVRIGVLTDVEFLTSCLKGSEVVIHAAALTRSSDPLKLKKSNEDITEALVKASEQSSVKRLVFLSSDLAQDPVGPYGRSKLACEHIIQSSKLKDWVIFRLSPVLLNKGEEGNSTFTKLIEKASVGYIALPGGGDFTVAPVWIEDLQRLISIVSNKKKVFKKIYNVNGSSITLRQFVHLTTERKVYILTIPIGLIGLAINLLSGMNISHPMFESLKAIGKNTMPSTQELFDDFGFSTSNLECVLRERL